MPQHHVPHRLEIRPGVISISVRAAPFDFAQDRLVDALKSDLPELVEGQALGERFLLHGARAIVFSQVSQVSLVSQFSQHQQNEASHRRMASGLPVAVIDDLDVANIEQEPRQWMLV